MVFEGRSGVGGLWRTLPAWQDIQISTADWALGDLPLAGPAQPQILANIEAWVERFGLADGIRLDAPVRQARPTAEGWELETPQGPVRARHLVAATGGHNTPVIPRVQRVASAVREVHASALRDPAELRGQRVLVVGGGASAFDLIDQCLEHGAAHIAWAYRGLKWFVPTGKSKQIAGSVRGFARLQASGMSAAEQSTAIGADMRGRYAKFGIEALLPDHAFDVLHDQLIPGRPRMLANFSALQRHRGSVAAIEGHTVTLSGGEQIEADWLLWGTGYAVDLAWLAVPALAEIRTLTELGARCGCIFRSLDAPNLYFPGVGLDGIGSAPWANALMARSVMSHIRGTAKLDMAPVAHKVNHFDLVEYLAARDPGSFPAQDWRSHYRAMALGTPDQQPYPVP